MAPIPITIVTGFLGSGKTTLILNLLPQLRATNPSYQLALLKNEFGDVAVDSQLAGSSAISGVRELLNGCICCNLVGQLSTALEELRLQTSAPPDRIVIETSGSAFPATLAIEVNRLVRETGGAYLLDGVVSLIDVENWRGYEDTSYTARIQARYTDLIVFNKWEGCDERRFDECLDRVGDLEVDTAWVKSDKGRVPVDVVFGVDGGLARALGEGGGGNKSKKEDHSHDTHGHDDHQTEVEVLSVTLKQKPRGIGDQKESSSTEQQGGAVQAEKLMALLKSAPKDEVYRIKAVLTVSGTIRNSADDDAQPTPPHSSSRVILNWAFGRWTFTPLTADAEDSSSNNAALRMTLILARYESTKWKKKLETGDFLVLDGSVNGKTEDDAEGRGGNELVVTKIS